jgi:hypothetical protein
MIVKLDRHEAKATGASTRWILPPGARLIHSTHTTNKTHWYEYWEVPEGSVLTRVRVSNRGNVHVSEIPAEQLRAPESELKFLEVPG